MLCLVLLRFREPNANSRPRRAQPAQIAALLNPYPTARGVNRSAHPNRAARYGIYRDSRGEFPHVVASVSAVRDDFVHILQAAASPAALDRRITRPIQRFK